MDPCRQVERLDCSRLCWVVVFLVAMGDRCVFGIDSASDVPGKFRIATFEADVTIPLGHPIIAGARMPAKEIVDPLTARGFVLQGAGKPLVVVAVEWCELRNDAYDRWRDALAEAANTDRQHVLVTATHVHDAPVVDLTAQKLLDQAGATGRVCDLEFHEQCVRRTADAVIKSLANTQRVTHIGVGQGKVFNVACNRRYELGNRKLSFHRNSMKSDRRAREAPDGTIDPMLKTLSFWDGDRPLVALHTYAVHPMSFYGKGGVSDDFVGRARRQRQADDETVFQIYTSGCSGNITTGKYNDGTLESRAELANRLHEGMVAAWKETERYPLVEPGFRCLPLQLRVREEQGYTAAELWNEIKSGSNPATSTRNKPFDESLAAMALSWRQRVERGQAIDLPVVDLGAAMVALFPAETYVEYQLFAQKLVPEKFVVVMGYGECAPGYIPTDQAVAEGDSNLDLWRWVETPCEKVMKKTISDAFLTGPSSEAPSGEGAARATGKD